MTSSPVDRHEIHTVVRLPYQKSDAEVRERDHACYVRDNRISRTEKGEIAGGKPANSDIT